MTPPPRPKPHTVAVARHAARWVHRGLRVGLAAALALGLAACGPGDEPPGTSVYKPFGSQQCGGGGLSRDALAQQLLSAGVAVLSARCGSDGLARAAVCGAPDGRIAIFRVPDTQVALARGAGFGLLSELPQASDGPCP